MAGLPADIDLDGLLALGGRGGIDIRPALLRVTTDLYVAKDSHSAEEETHFAEIAQRLIDVVDADTRAAVTAKLRTCAQTPAALRARLGDAVSVAGFDRRTTAGDLHALFIESDSETRRLILFALDDAAWTPVVLADDIDRETVARLEIAALRSDRVAFTAELAQALAIDPALASALVADASGEPIVAAARALAIPDSVLQRILLCLDPVIARSIEQVYRLSDLYEEIAPEAALRLVALWQRVRVATEDARDVPAMIDAATADATEDGRNNAMAPPEHAAAATFDVTEDAIYADRRVTLPARTHDAPSSDPASHLWTSPQEQPRLPPRPSFRWDAVSQIA